MSGVTLDSLLLAVLIALITFAFWVMKRWAIRIETSIDEVKEQRSMCVQDFARQMDMNNAFGTLRKHGERIAALESWRADHNGK